MPPASLSSASERAPIATPRPHATSSNTSRTPSQHRDRAYDGIVISAGNQPQETIARISAVSHQRAYIDSWIRQTGMETPKKSTLLDAVLAHSMSSR